MAGAGDGLIPGIDMASGATVQQTTCLFGPGGLGFMKFAAKMDEMGTPVKLTYGVNGHGGTDPCFLDV